MSDLRVTDVQAALRHLKGLGHDVLTDPRALHLTNHPDEEPQAYRMAAGHRLVLSKEGNIDHFSTYLMQSERPLISTVQTAQNKRYTNGIAETVHSRSIYPFVPVMGRSFTAEGSTDAEHHHFDWGNHHNRPLGPSYHGSDTEWSSAPSPIFRDHHYYNSNDIHDTLKAHTTDAVSHEGIRIMKHNKKQPMTSEEMTNFSVPHALSNLLTGAQPFKGLVTVRHQTYNGLINYHYNPDTEELFNRGKT